MGGEGRMYGEGEGVVKVTFFHSCLSVYGSFVLLISLRCRGVTNVFTDKVVIVL